MGVAGWDAVMIGRWRWSELKPDSGVLKWRGEGETAMVQSYDQHQKVATPKL